MLLRQHHPALSYPRALVFGLHGYRFWAMCTSPRPFIEPTLSPRAPLHYQNAGRINRDRCCVRPRRRVRTTVLQWLTRDSELLNALLNVSSFPSKGCRQLEYDRQRHLKARTPYIDKGTGCLRHCGGVQNLPSLVYLALCDV